MADISLTVGVDVSASLSEFKSGIQSLVSSIDSNPPKIKIKLDDSSLNTMKKQIKSITNSMSDIGKISNGYTKSTAGIWLKDTEAIKANTQAKNDNAIASKKRAAATNKGVLEDIKVTTQNITSAYKSLNKQLGGSTATGQNAQDLDALQKKYIELTNAIAAYKSADTTSKPQKVNDVYTKQAEMQKLIDLTRERISVEQEAAKAAASAAKEQAKSSAMIGDDPKSQESWLKKLRALSDRIDKVSKYTAAKGTEDYERIQKAAPDVENLIDKTIEGKIAIGDVESGYSEMSETVASSSAAIRDAGKNTQSLGDRLTSLGQKFSSWLTVSQAIMFGVRTMKQMVQASMEVESAMAQIQIVTGASDSQMESFLSNSISLAKELGQSVTDVASSIETFARLGYNMSDSTNLAKYANIMSNVGDTDVDTATTGITSIIKGYELDASDAEHVSDVLVKVGQEYAISAEELMAAFQRGGAALHASGTDFEKSAALFAATNASLQNAETTGTLWKTVSARIRGATTELESMGEETDGVAEGLSKYRDEIKALSGVDIMKDEHTYKDMYDIFVQLAQVWDNMEDVSQSRVAEILGGTRNTSGIMSTITNINDAIGAYTSAMDSAGASTRANAIYMDTTAAKLGTLKASFQELSTDLINSDFIKNGVSFLDGIVNGIDGATKTLGSLGSTIVGLGLAKFAKDATKSIKSMTDKKSFENIIKAFSESEGMLGKVTTKAMEAGSAFKKARDAGEGLGSSLLAAFGSKAALAAAGVGIVAAGALALYKHDQAVKAEQLKTASEEGTKWQEANSAIESYKQQVIDLRTQLAAGSLTEAEAYNAKSQLLSIQQSLTASYGDQVSGIDLVNGSLQQQIDLMDQISQKEASDYLNKNEKGTDEAIKQMEKERAYNIGSFYDIEDDKGSSAIKSALEKINEKYGDVITKEENNGEITLRLNADASQAEDVLNDFMSYLRTSSNEIGENGILDNMISSASKSLNEAGDTVAKYQDVYDKARAAQIAADSTRYQSKYSDDERGKTASKWLSDYTDAVNKYNEALASGDSSKIIAAQQNFEAIDKSVKSLTKDSGMKDYADSFNEVREQLDSAAVSANNLKQAIDGTDKSSKGKALSDAAQKLKDLNLDDVDFMDAFNTDGLQKGEVEINKLINAAYDAGIISDKSSESVQSFVDMLVQLGIVSGQPVSGLTDTETAVNNLKESLSSIQEVFSQVQTAMSNSKSATGLTADDITNLQSAYKDLEGYSPYKLFEETANGVHLNRDELQRLNEELTSNKLADFSKSISDITSEIYQERAKGNDTSYLEQQLANAKLLKSELEGTTSAYNNLLNSMNGSKERDSYENIGSAYESMRETLNQGWYGDESLNAYLDLLLSAQQRTGDAEADFAKLNETIAGTSHSIMDYWQYDGNNKLVTDGLYDFLDDVNLKLGDSFAKVNEDGAYEFNFDGDKLQQVADAFGISTEAVEMFERAMIDAGVAVDMSDVDFTGQVDKAKEALKELQDAGEISSDIELDFDVDEEPLDDVKSYIEQLQDERINIDAEANPEAAAALDELISMCEQTYYVRLNAETDGALDQAVSIVNQLNGMNITVGVSADDSEINSLASELASLPPEVQIAVGVKAENVGDANAIISQLVQNPGTITVPVNYKKNSEPSAVDDATGKANYNLGTSPTTVPDATGTANFTLGSYPTWVPSVTQNVIQNVTQNVTKSKKGKADGTAYAEGTLQTPHAYAYGRNWSLLKDEDALVNELGTESIVRDGQWFPIPGGAHIAQLKKGDIVFTAEQTKQLIQTGRITSGGGHGRIAFADGTAFNTLNIGAYDKGSGGKRRTGSTSSSKRSSSSRRSSSSSSHSSNSSSSKSSSSSDDSSKEFEETIDWIEIAIKRIEEAIDRIKIKAESVFEVLSVRNQAASDEISKITEQIDLQNRAYDAYMEKANSIGLDEAWAAKVRNGAIQIEDITDENLSDKIKDYQDFYEKAIEAKDAVADLHEEIAKLYQDKFDNISNDFENQLKLLEHLTTTYDNGIDDLDERGYLATTKYYEAMQKVSQQNIDVQKKELSSLITSMSEAVNSGKIKEGSEAWYDMQQDINSVKEAIQESGTELVKFQNSIREIKWDRFDYLQEQISNITDEADFLIDLMENSELYKDNGQLTDTGQATMGLHGQNYNVYMAQADKYAKELKKLNAEIANDPNNTKLLEHRQDLLEAQRDAILSAEDEKQAIKDLVEDGIDKELDALKDLIDKYEDSLDSAKDLYDYNKKLNDQTSEISKLQKQLSAYAGDDSEETKSTIQKIQVDLKDAMDDLEETQYEHYISDQKKLLDDMYNEYELILNERLDNIDALISDMIDNINANSSTINDTLLSQSEKVGYDMTESMKSIWANDGGAFTIITKYGDAFTSALTSVNNVLNSISMKIGKMIGESDEKADTTISSTTASTKTEKTKAPPKQETPKHEAPKKQSNAKSDKDYYGVALAVCDGCYGWGSGNTRRSRLQSKGFDPNRVQSIVNQMFRDGYIHSGAWVGKYYGIRDVSPYHYNRYKTGGLVDYTGLAQLDGTPGSPELVLNSEDTKNFIALKDALRNAANGNNPLYEMFYGRDSSQLVDRLSQIDLPSVSKQSAIGDISYQVNIPIDHVEDYNDFMNKMRKDSKFEQFIQSMTIDRIVGGSKISKNKFQW